MTIAWPTEDAGPDRRQIARGVPSVRDRRFTVTARQAPAATMVVHRQPGEAYLLRHTAGDDAVSWVERLDLDSLEAGERSPDLPGGPTWPGSVGVHPDGSLHVVFGRHAHRLGPDCSLEASAELPRHRPYNGFVILGDGTLVTKDFAGSRPGHAVAAADREPCELVALDPATLAILDRLVLPEPSIARLSARGDEVWVVGDTSLLRVRWAAGRLFLDESHPAVPYRTQPGQTYGWDCVVEPDGTAWFLDDGEGSEAYTGTLRGHGTSTSPLHLVRIDAGGAVSTAEVCGLPGGLIANPPVIDRERGIAVGYDSGNGVIAGFDLETLQRRWSREQDHGAHLVLLADHGEVVTHDFRGADGEHLVVLDVASGEEIARYPTGSPVQSVLFPSVDHDGGLWSVSFTTVTRLRPS